TPLAASRLPRAAPCALLAAPRCPLAAASRRAVRRTPLASSRRGGGPATARSPRPRGRAVQRARGAARATPRRPTRRTRGGRGLAPTRARRRPCPPRMSPRTPHVPRAARAPPASRLALRNRTRALLAYARLDADRDPLLDDVARWGGALHVTSSWA